MPLGAHGQATTNPLSDFLNAASNAYDICLSFAPTNDQRACLEKQRPQVDAKWEMARKAIVKPRGQELTMLRDFYSYWYAAFGDLPPRGDELKPNYTARTGDSLRTIREKAVRLELEAGIR